MRREKNYKTARLIEALEYIDVRFIEEAAEKIKVRPTGQAFYGKPSRSKALRQILALAACVLLLSAAIPAITYLANHLPDIVAFFIGDETTDTDPELTHPETPSPETSSSPETTVNTEPETTAPLYDGTTAEPEAEYDGSRGLLYKMSDDGKSYYLAGMGTCTDENIVVASTYDGYPVTVIGEDALAGYDRIKSITIPESVTAIDMRAFKNCTGLESITIPDTVYYISGDAFMNCTSLKSIKLPASLKLVNPGVFSNCTALEEIMIPDFVTEIMVGAFYECTNLKTVTLGRRIEKLWADVFMDCDNLTEINFSGTMARWNAIEKDDEWNFGSIITVVHCSDGDIEIKSITPEPEYDGSRGLKYHVIGDFAQLDSIGTCTDTDIVVASYYYGYPVKWIGESAFSGLTQIKSIRLSDTVERIQSYAFRDCTSLESIYIGSGFKDFNSNAFWGCVNISKIEVDPDNNFYEGKNCIINKSQKALVLGCKTTVIPDDGSVTHIGGRAFNDVIGLTSITIPEGITSLGEDAFSGCPDLKSIHFSSTVNSFELVSVMGCDALEVITVDSKNPKFYSSGNCVIGKETGTLFLGCGGSVIPNDGSIKKIGYYAFGSNDSLTNIVIPNGVTHIDGYAFAGCAGLKEIILPDSVTRVGFGVFSGCSSLERFEFSENTKTIGSWVFDNCVNLREVKMPKYGSIGEGVFSGCSSLESIVIPIGQDILHIGTFSACINLKSVVLPDTLTQIHSPFPDCTSLKSITIPAGVTIIENQAFIGCTSLTEFNFKGTASEWKKVTKENGWNRGCPFTVIHCSDGDVDLIEYDGSRGLEYRIEGDHAVLVGIGTCTDKDIVIASTYNGVPVVIIEDGVFKNNKNIRSVTIPDKVHYIGEDAFAFCTSLESVIMPDNLKTLGTDAFNGCTSLVSISIPAGITEIDSYAFSGCSSLKEIAIPEGVTVIGNEAFYLCKNLKSVTLPSTLEYIQDWAFANCESLESIVIPDSVKWIGQRAFSDCAKLSSVTLGQGLEQIQGSAFHNCAALKSVKFPRGLKLIEAGAFSGCTSLADIAYAGTVSEWNFVDSTGEGYYYQSFTWHKDVPAQKIRCSDGEAMLDSPSAGRYRAVLNNEAKFILDSKEIFLDEFCFPYSGLSITACDDVKYAIIDMDRNGENEVVITGANGDMLVLHDENGKFYGFDFSFRNMDRIKTDGSFEWNDMTADGLSYGDARLSFDSDKCQKKNICHVTGDGTDNVQFFVDGNPTTREDYLNAYASISKTEVTWYPIERYPIN